VEWSLSLIVRVILGILASYRITNLFVFDDGPFDVFKGIRAIVGKIAARNMKLKGLAILFNCPFCLGMWVSALMSLLVLFPSAIGDVGMLVFAIAGGQDFLTSLGIRKKE